jgi:hypothetical protein
MTDELPDDRPEPNPIPDDRSERQALAERLASRADDDPEAITRDEMATVVALLSVTDPETRVAAAEALQHLYGRPPLFAPFVGDLIDAAGPYPDDVEGIPAPIEWMGSETIRAAVYVADSLARVAQERPELFVPHAAEVGDRLREGPNYPRHLLFAVAYAEAVDGDAVPREWLVDELCGLLDRGHGNGYPSWAADSLRVIGASEALPALRAAYPDDSADDATREAFDDAIASLEADAGAGTGDTDA